MHDFVLCDLALFFWFFPFIRLDLLDGLSVRPVPLRGVISFGNLPFGSFFLCAAAALAFLLLFQSYASTSQKAVGPPVHLCGVMRKVPD